MRGGKDCLGCPFQSYRESSGFAGSEYLKVSGPVNHHPETCHYGNSKFCSILEYQCKNPILITYRLEELVLCITCSGQGAHRLSVRRFHFLETLTAIITDCPVSGRIHTELRGNSIGAGSHHFATIGQYIFGTGAIINHPVSLGIHSHDRNASNANAPLCKIEFTAIGKSNGPYTIAFGNGIDGSGFHQGRNSCYILVERLHLGFQGRYTTLKRLNTGVDFVLPRTSTSHKKGCKQ